MNPFETIKRMRDGYPAFGPSLPEFRPFGRDNAVSRHTKYLKRLADRLKPEEHGRNDAVMGEPNFQRDDLSTYDAQTRSIFQGEIDLLQEQTERELKKIDHHLKRLPPAPSFKEAPIIAVSEARMEALLRADRTPLVDSKRAELIAGRKQSKFRRENPAVAARSVQSHNPLITVPGMLAVASIEAVLNFELLLRSGGHSPTEIVTFVLLASLFNLLFGVAAGFLGIRNLCHRSIRRNLAGALVLLGAGALIVGLASYMAHYRYAIDGVLNNPQAMADATLRLQLMAVAKSSVRQTMARDFFAFAGDLNAVLIFLLGIVFGGIAAVEGYQLLDDPYPGYGAVVRLSKRARQTHEAGVRYLENQFIAVVESAAEPAEAALARAHRRLSEIKICLDTASRIIERYEKAATAVEHALFKIVMNYRDEYRRTKGTAGPPHWEEDIPRLNRELSFDIANLIAIEDRVTGEAHGLEDRVTQLKAQLAQVQAQKISRLKEYLALVDQDAVQEEAMALANLTGLRMPAPPDLNFSMGGSGEHSEESSHDAKTRD